MLAVLMEQAKLWSADFGDRELAEDVLTHVDVAELLRRFVPVHAAALDDETVLAVTRFFETDAGQKFVAAQERIVPGITKVAHDYGLELAQEGANKRPSN